MLISLAGMTIIMAFILFLQIVESSETSFDEEISQYNTLNKTICSFYKENKSLINPTKMVNRKSTLLLSYPGSGNTWVRLLIEIVTGVYTGSIYVDKDLFALFPMENRCGPQLSVIKGHPESFELCSNSSSSASKNSDDINNSYNSGSNTSNYSNNNNHNHNSNVYNSPIGHELCIINNPKQKCNRGHHYHHHQSTITATTDRTRFSKFIFLVRDPMNMIFAEFQRLLHRGKHNRPIPTLIINEKLLLRFQSTVLMIAKQMKADWEKSLYPIISHHSPLTNSGSSSSSSSSSSSRYSGSGSSSSSSSSSKSSVSSSSSSSSHNNDSNSGNNPNVLVLRYENLVDPEQRYQELSEVSRFLDLNYFHDDNDDEISHLHHHHRVRCAFESSNDNRILRNKTATSPTLSMLMKKQKEYEHQQYQKKKKKNQQQQQQRQANKKEGIIETVSDQKGNHPSLSVSRDQQRLQQQAMHKNSIVSSSTTMTNNNMNNSRNSDNDAVAVVIDSISFACEVWDNIKDYSHYFGYTDSYCHG